jgi:LPXTG-site transpeptidase (sortase) family protein
VEGNPYFLQFAIANNGNLASGAVNASISIPEYLDVVSINTYFTTTPGMPSPEDSYTVSLTGNSLIIHFDSIAPGNTYTFLISTVVNSLVTRGTTNVSVFLDSSAVSCGDVIANDTSFFALAASGPVVAGGSTRAPETGFAPGMVTVLPPQPKALRYLAVQDVSIEIPALDLNIPILGVPFVENGWDASWLGGSAGWLNGTAYPGYVGNSVIVGHVYLPSGLAGPFVDLETLKWGDHIIIHEGDRTLTFVVRTVEVLDPDDASIMAHADKPTLTLVTCKGYNELTGHYNNRVVVKAILVNVN